LAAVSLAFNLIIVIALGVFARKRGIVGEGFEQSLTSLMINITLPCMIIQSLRMPLSPGGLRNCASILLLGCVVLVFYFAVGFLMYRVVGRGSRGRTFRFGTIFNNYTFMGLPVIDSLFGQAGMFVIVIFVIPFRLAYFCSAKPMLSPPALEKTPLSLRGLCGGFFNPPVAAALVGMFFYLTQFPLAEPISHVLTQVGGVSSPLGMLLCGISLGSFAPRDFAQLRRLALPLFRNCVMPLLTIALVLPLPVEPLMKQVVTVFAALPVASLLAAFTIQFDPGADAKLESAGAVFFSTLLSPVTVPLFALLAAHIFPL
jgi:predicted permease